MSSSRHAAVALALVLTLPVFAGCVSLSETLSSQAVNLPAPAYDTARGWSVPLSPALYEILEGVKTHVPSFDQTPISIGIFRPDVPGCDWSADALPEACRLPTVIDAGPYYLSGIGNQKFRPPLAEWLVPRGYAVVYMALRGTGESGGCMEFKSVKDVDDVSAVIDWIAAQAWSSGNVGMAGRSYDGTAAWSGAASGNAHLKTIMPISGAVNAPYLYFKNGTAEVRALTPHLNTYWSDYALGLGASDPSYRVQDWPQNVCPEVAQAHTESLASFLTGDGGAQYWQSRDLTGAILKDYRGSVWVVHGMEDWNVNPSQAVPFINQMQDAGIEVRAWLGQWGHAYPDRMDEHRNVRWDWADEVVKWFDFYLKGAGTQPRLGVEVEDSLYVWRHEASYPPRDVAYQAVEFHGEAVGAGQASTFTTDPFEREVRLAGLSRLHFEAIPTTPTGGHVFAELYDVFPDGRSVRIAWGGINLRFHEGSNVGGRTLVPFEPVVAKLEFEPADALVAKGHRLRLVMHKDGVEDVHPSPDPALVLIGNSQLLLSTIERPTVIPTYKPLEIASG